jgi:hypothetical protein
MLKHLLVSQSGPLVYLRVFHVAIAEFSKRDLDGLFVNPTQDLRFSERQKSLGIATTGTVRRLLDSVPVLIVQIDPVDVPSFVDTHLRLAFYPVPAARVF